MSVMCFQKNVDHGGGLGVVHNDQHLPISTDSTNLVGGRGAGAS